MASLLIYADRNDLGSVAGGSTIRIKGYVKAFENEGVDFIFAGPEKPPYVQREKFEKIEINQRFKTLVRVYNVLSRYALCMPLCYFLAIIICLNSEIAKLAKVAKGRTILAERTATTPLFLHRTKGYSFIYDIHGFDSLNLEFKNLTSWTDKLYFKLVVQEETEIINSAPYINAVSFEMKQYLQETYSPTGKIFIARDGFIDNSKSLPDISLEDLRNSLGVDEEEKVIFFAGSFKKFGGVHLLAQAFKRVVSSVPKARLVLIGSGQMKEEVQNIISDIQHKVTLIPKIDYEKLPVYQQLADVLVCPDVDSTYNRMVIHIKVFDCIRAAKPVVCPRLPVLVNHFEDSLLYFEPSNVPDLAETIKSAISEKEARLPLGDISRFSYRHQAKQLLKEYYEEGILCVED